MGLEPSDNQCRLNEYQQVVEDKSGWACNVCGFESQRKSVVKACHPKSQLNRERDTAVTDRDDEHVGFVFPPQMNSKTRTVLTSIRQALEQVNESAVLPTAATALDQHLPNAPEETQAFQLFTHLVWLQQYQVLPGYPVGKTEIGESKATIRQFCNSATQFPGPVSESDIQDSELVERSRMYRRKVLSVTPQFFEQSEIAGENLAFYRDWNVSYSDGWAGVKFCSYSVFGESTAHNTVVRKCRDWLATHPRIDWACVPHTIGAPPTMKTESSTQPTQETGSEPTPNSVYMYDFAGFTGTSQSQLAVIGCVIGSESVREMLTKINHVRETEAVALVIVLNRTSIYTFLYEAHNQGLLQTPVVPTNNVSEYYARLPSIQAVNEEIRERIPEFDHVHFVTIKQLIDDVIAPVDVFPAGFSAGVPVK